MKSTHSALWIVRNISGILARSGKGYWCGSGERGNDGGPQGGVVGVERTAELLSQ